MRIASRPLLFAFALALAGSSLEAQTPTISNVTGVGTNLFCPGGRAYVSGANLGGSSATVTVGSKQAYVRSVSNTFLDVQLPVDAPLGPTTLKVGASAAVNITLVQYAPGVLTDGLPDDIASAFHVSSQKPVTAGSPASPNEQIALNVNGLGPTNPPVATGFIPSDNSVVTATLPGIAVGGQSAKVSTAYLSDAGIYTVVFTVPAGVAAGNQKITVSIGGSTSGPALLPVATGPIVSTVSNAASYIDPSLPNGGIAQGSIFVVQGNNLGPATLTTDTKTTFQNTILAGTSVSVTVNGTTAQALMYYTSANQIAALLPSNTPAGTGTLTVTYNNQTGPAYPITVVPNALGIFTVTSDGQGAGIVTYPDYSLVSVERSPNCGGPYTTCGAANPGDVLTIWATGLGPINGNDAKGDGLGVNMPNIPLTIWLGSVSVSATYQGRGCCIGEDQIIFTVPANAPTGCAVPLSIQIGNVISNVVALPIAIGQRACTPADPKFPAGTAQRLTARTGPFSYAEIDLKHVDQQPGFKDVFTGQFLKFNIAPAVQPFFMSYADMPPIGSCAVVNNLNGFGSNVPLTPVAPLDFGPQISVQGPGGTKNAPASGGQFLTTIDPKGNFLVPGTYTVTTPGGADVPAFSASISIPTMPTMTSPQPDAANPVPVTRADGLTVNWSGGGSAAYVEMEVYSATDNTYNKGADVVCSAPAAAGTFTVPPSALLALPAGNFAQLAFRPHATPVNPDGTGVNAPFLSAWYASFTSLSLK
ncbi:MAG TPA: hypothetical protein VKX45_01050 [Bryobacteraceae bacterium]|nr:hypothetical protein [Bryobacteraceae bacterium]